MTKNYKRNERLIDCITIEDNQLVLKDMNKNPIVICTFTSTKTCVRVIQVSTNASRYFTDVNKALNHLKYNQAITTNNRIDNVFKKWIKQNIEK